jgi:hypothetical protein
MKFATILMATCAMIGATSAQAETSAEPTAPQPKLIDLDPLDWRSSLPRGKQPFFGKGAPEWAAYVVGLALSLAAVKFFSG